MPIAPQKTWRDSFASYLDRRSIALLLLGFSAGLPLLLIFSSLSLWLREAGVERSTVTMFSWAALFYSFKFIWAPLVDLVPIPFLTRRMGRRRSWLIAAQDRKSTRLNSSHVSISYAVFCLKKKTYSE